MGPVCLCAIQVLPCHTAVSCTCTACTARYLRHIEQGYLDNPYHSATHAADVLQSLHVVLHRGRLVEAYCGGPEGVGLLAAYMAAVSAQHCSTAQAAQRGTQCSTQCGTQCSHCR